MSKSTKEAPRVVRSTRGAPGLAVALVLAMAACTAQAHPVSMSQAPSVAATPAPGWHLVAAPRGFLAHDAAVHAGRVWLAGDRVSPVAGGAVLEVDPSTGDITEHGAIPALHLRSIAFSADGTVWSAGQTTDGRGLVAGSTDGRSWRSERLPEDVDDVTALAASNGDLWASGTASRDGIVLLRHNGRWRAVVRVPAVTGFARLEAVAAAPGAVAAVGSDGARAVVLAGRTGGLRQLPAPAGMTRATGVTLGAGDSFVVSGRRGSGESSRRGVIATRIGATWALSAQPGWIDVSGVATGPRRIVVAVAATGRGDVVLSSHDGGRTWRAAEPDAADANPATLEVALIDGDTGYAAGPTGLYAGPL